MYNFIDVNEVSDGVVLPSEALKINGQYIENQIAGYRTLSVSGREALSPDVETYTTGVRDGSRVKRKRYPERIITVRYQLIAKTNEEFRAAYNKLAAILNVDDANLIFNDEQDKFYIGTPCTIGSVDPGTNSVIGSFEILCADPFKYSVVEYEATADLDKSSVLIDYNGTYKSFPTLEAEFYGESEINEDGVSKPLTGKGECGYVAFFNENRKIVQLGNPDEANTATYAKSQTLVSQNLVGQNAWGTAAQALWTLNGGDTLAAEHQKAGSVAMNVASYLEAEVPSTTGTLIITSSKTEEPIFDYKVTAKAHDRTADSVKVTITATTALRRSTNYFKGKRGLEGSVQIGGEWHTFTIRKEGEHWSGRTAHTATKTITVDVEKDTVLLEDIKFKVTRTDDLGESGIVEETECTDLEISKYVDPVPELYYLTAEHYGTVVGKWHGPSITRRLPADEAGDIGAKNFSLSCLHGMSIGDGVNASNQKGGFQIMLSNDEGRVVAGLGIFKSKAGTEAEVRFYLNDALFQSASIPVGTYIPALYEYITYGTKSYVTVVERYPELDIRDEMFLLKNKVKQASTKYSYVTVIPGETVQIEKAAATTAAAENPDKLITIDKDGSKITFTVGTLTKSFTSNAIKDLAVTKINLAFEQWSVTEPMEYNGVYWLKFVKNNCDTARDIPNRFSACDIVEADCKSGEILLNGLNTPSLGALGNDWEDFYLTPGLNQIGFVYSDWLYDEDSKYAPTPKIRYREVFL